MFHIGRSGSTVLGDLLRQHPTLFWDGEVYERDVFWQYPPDGLPPDLRVPPRELVKSRLPRAGRMFYGFEVKFFHLDLAGTTLPEFIDALEALHFEHFVVLRRENLLRKIVSSVIAHRAGDFHRAKGSAHAIRHVEIDPQRVAIDQEEKPLLAFLEDFEARFEALDALLEGHSVLRLTFEEDVAPDPRIGYRKICQFLDVEPRPVEVRYGTTNPFPLRQLVTNFGDLERVLLPTRFAWMLES